MTFIAGYDKGVTWTPSGGGGDVDLNVTGHSWSEMIDALDVTHTGTDGFQAMISGILRGDGNVKANSDDEVIIGDATKLIRAGQGGVLKFHHYALGGNPFTVPAIITKVNYKSVVEGKAEYDFDVKLNVLEGDYTRPT